MTKILQALIRNLINAQPLLLSSLQLTLHRYGPTLFFLLLCLVGYERASRKQNIQINSLRSKKVSLEEQLMSTADRITYKQALLDHVDSPAFIERLLIQKLGMVPKNGLRIKIQETP